MRGGPRGDLVVVIEVEEDPRFARDGADLVYELPISYTQAVLGAEIEIPTVDSAARLRIPAGTQSGRILRLRERGLPRLQAGGRGDLLVQVIVWIPADPSGEERALLQDLAKIETPPPRTMRDRDGRGFWSKVRGAFSV
jgi:molecular chaperone DnaJ